MSVAVVGAGLSGAVLSVLLRQSGREVAVFDKGRGTGGRLATRRHESGPRFDHGCPGIPLVAGDPLGPVLQTLADQGSAARWDGALGAMAVGVPGMSAIVKTLLGPLPVTTSFEVARAERGGEGWRLVSRTGEAVGPFEALFLTVPAPQLVPLVETAAPHVAAAAAGASYDPAWTLMLAFEPAAVPRLADLAPDALAERGVATAIHDGGKPGRDGAATLVCHMAADWSREHLERERTEVAADVAPRIAAALDLPAPALALAHRWRYARVSAAGSVAPYDAGLALGVAGDWTAGSTTHDAFASAVRCAEAAGKGR